MNRRNILLPTMAEILCAVSTGALSVPLPNWVDVTGPDGSMSRWYLSDNNTRDGNVASDGLTFDRYNANDGHHRLYVEGIPYQEQTMTMV